MNTMVPVSEYQYHCNCGELLSNYKNAIIAPQYHDTRGRYHPPLYDHQCVRCGRVGSARTAPPKAPVDGAEVFGGIVFIIILIIGVVRCSDSGRWKEMWGYGIGGFLAGAVAQSLARPIGYLISFVVGLAITITVIAHIIA